MRDLRTFFVPFPIVSSVSAGVTEGTVQARVALPLDAKPKRVLVHASAIGTGTSTIDVYDLTAAASILSANITISAANTKYTGDVSSTYSNTEQSQGRLYSLRATTGASTGSITNLQAYLICERDERATVGGVQ